MPDVDINKEWSVTSSFRDVTNFSDIFRSPLNVVKTNEYDEAKLDFDNRFESIMKRGKWRLLRANSEYVGSTACICHHVSLVRKDNEHMFLDIDMWHHGGINL